LRSLCAPVYLDRDAVLEETPGSTFDSRLADEIDRRIQSLVEIEILGEAERQHVDSTWEKKLDIVPGDELLDCVCKTFGVRFKKRRDGARLAHLLEVTEISPELVDLLRRLTA
jgi:putative ATP-dependent endonuclease of OLD family